MSQKSAPKSQLAQQKLMAMLQNTRVSKRPKPKKISRYGIKSNTSSESEARQKGARQHATSVPPPKFPNVLLDSTMCVQGGVQAKEKKGKGETTATADKPVKSKRKDNKITGDTDKVTSKQYGDHPMSTCMVSQTTSNKADECVKSKLTTTIGVDCNNAIENRLDVGSPQANIFVDEESSKIDEEEVQHDDVHLEYSETDSESSEDDITAIDDTTTTQRDDHTTTIPEGSNELQIYVKVSGKLLKFSAESLSKTLSSGKFHRASVPSSCNVTVDVAETLLKIMEGVKTIMGTQDRILQSIDALENSNNADVSRPHQLNRSRLPKLPLQNLEEQKKAEELFTTNTAARAAMVNSLSLLAGKKLAESVPLIMRALMSKELRLLYNAQRAMGNKISLRDTELFDLLLDSIRVRHQDATDKEILLLMGKLLVGTPDESGGREGRRAQTAIKRLAVEQYMAQEKRKQNGLDVPEDVPDED